MARKAKEPRGDKEPAKRPAKPKKAARPPRAAVHLSPYHFARMFRRSTALSPHAFLTKRRLERAKELLASTPLPMQEIARRVGYRNQAHFSRAFHAGAGIVPRRYRMQNRDRPGVPAKA